MPRVSSEMVHHLVDCPETLMPRCTGSLRLAVETNLYWASEYYISRMRAPYLMYVP